MTPRPGPETRCAALAAVPLMIDDASHDLVARWHSTRLQLPTTSTVTMAPPAAKGVPVDCTGLSQACCTDVHTAPDHDTNSRIGTAFGFTWETTTVGGRPRPVAVVITDAAPHVGSVTTIDAGDQPALVRWAATTFHGTPTASGDTQAASTLPDVSAAADREVGAGVLVPSVSRVPQPAALP